MRVVKFLIVAAAASMTVAPALAAPANPAASLSIAKSVRTGTVAGKKSKMGGSGFVIAAIAAAAVVAGIVVVATDDSDSK